MKYKTPKCGISLHAMSVVIVSLLVLLFVSGTAAWSQTAQGNGQQAEKKVKVEKAEPTVFVSGQKVAIDPETKKIRELTPEEAKALSEDLKNFVAKQPGELKVYQYPNGMLAVELPEEYMDSMVVKRNPDGTLSTECVGGLKSSVDRIQSQIKDPAKSGQKVANPDKPTPKPRLEEE